MANPKNKFCLSDIRKHKVFEIMLSFALYQYIQIMGNVQAHQRQGNAAELLTHAAPCSAQYITLFL